MTVQEVADILGPLGFIPEWRLSQNAQEWHNPQTNVRLSVRKIDKRIQFRKHGNTPGGVFSEWQTDEPNYSDDIVRVLQAAS